MIDAVNVVDIFVRQRYWDNKVRVCRALSKTSGNPVTKPKGKRKRTRWEVSSYRHHNWSTENYEGAARYSSKCLEPAKYEINFLALLFHVVSDKDSIYHYPHCPVGSDSWCKYNAGRAIL